jgi:NAD(P)-dependent dehydrogenase (short-subunit alcohol dehydrogenase family)
VVITGRRREVLDAAVAELSASGVTATGLQGDVRSPDACQGWVTSTVQQFGHLNILVNCAAGNFLANAAELSQGGFKTGGLTGRSLFTDVWYSITCISMLHCRKCQDTQCCAVVNND